MLKKKYKPSRLNKWYVKHFILAPCARGFEVPEMAVVWWCFLASIYNSKSLSVFISPLGKLLIKVQKEGDEGFGFYGDADIFWVRENGVTIGTYKQVNGVVYEITYDTPVDE